MSDQKAQSVIQSLTPLLHQWVVEQRCGSITINFFKGGVSSVNLNETVKLENSCK